MVSDPRGNAYERLMRDDARRLRLDRALNRGIGAAQATLRNIQCFDARSDALRIVAQRGFDRVVRAIAP